MSLLSCGERKNLDKYASAKSIGEFSLSVSLIADDIKDLHQMFKLGEDLVEYFWVLVIIIAVSLGLQAIALIFALILYINKVPKPPKVDSDIAMHDNTTPTDTNTSRDDLAVRYDNGDSATAAADPMPALALRRLNDGLTVITILVAILHIIKNVMKPEVPGYNKVQ